MWPHLSSIPKQRVAKRQQVNVLIGSDHCIFHCVLQEVCVNMPDDLTTNLSSFFWSDVGRKIFVTKPGLTLLVRIVSVMSTTEENVLTMLNGSSR